jgi:hypothetical protein
MKPISFHKHEQIINAPPGQEETIIPLPAVIVEYADKTVAFVSCWSLSWRELWRLLRNRRIYLAVMAYQQPPILLATELEEVGLEDAQIVEATNHVPEQSTNGSAD